MRALASLTCVVCVVWFVGIAAAVLYAARNGSVGIEVAGCANGGAVVPSVIGDPAVCILRVMGADLAANMSFEAAAIDAAIRCLGSGSKENVARVTNLWQAHKAEELRERDGGTDQ